MFGFSTNDCLSSSSIYYESSSNGFLSCFSPFFESFSKSYCSSPIFFESSSVICDPSSNGYLISSNGYLTSSNGYLTSFSIFLNSGSSLTFSLEFGRDFFFLPFLLLGLSIPQSIWLRSIDLGLMEVCLSNDSFLKILL